LTAAGLWRRWCAFLVDQLLFLAAWGIFSGWIALFHFAVARRPLELTELALLTALLVLLWFALSLAWATAFVGGCGQTPGMMLLGIAVVRSDGMSVGYGRAFMRALGFGLAALPLGLGFAGVLFTRRRRGLHDWLAGTRVVRGLPLSAGNEPAPAGE
jgi:uncharacterized RDD family membrane protein YckC